MREGMGLYRGKLFDDDEWVEGYYVHLKDSLRKLESHRIYTSKSETDCGDFYPDWFEVDPETVGQWTGLVDKNGVKVFEGDLLKGQQGIMRVFYGKITGHGYGFQWENIGDGFEESMTGFIDEYEVIGSIHDKAVEE